MIRTTRDAALEKLEAVAETISIQTFEDLDAQALKCGANMIMRYGDKICTTPRGFLDAIAQSHSLALAWLVTEGYVTLTDKAMATQTERDEHKAMRDGGAIGPVDTTVLRRGEGGYV